MRIDAIESGQMTRLGNKWKSIANYPQTVSFRIRCPTLDSCDTMKGSLATDMEHFAPTIHLAFAYRLPNTTKSTLNMQSDHMQASPTFLVLNDRNPQASYVFIQKSDFDDLARETLWNSLESLLNTDEFVSDEQLDQHGIQLARKLRYNITSTTDFTPAMWQATFWRDESQRPDVIASGFEALFSNGKNWLKRVMKGENVATETGISVEASPIVTAAIAALKLGNGQVRWNGNDIVIEAFPMYCVALGALRENISLKISPIFIMKRTADYVTTALGHSTAAILPGLLESKVRRPNDTFGDTVVTMIRNPITDYRHYQTKCSSFESNGTVTLLMRDADTMWSLNHTVVTATVQTADGSPICQELTATSDPFGEFSLSLPKNGIPLVLTIMTAGYYPIVLRNVRLDVNPDVETTFMEPLLFISKRFPGIGTATGKVYGLKLSIGNPYLLSGVSLDFRSGMNTGVGLRILTIQTLADGTWSASLPAGHYTVTASMSGFITMTFTVVVLGGKATTYDYMTLSTNLDSTQIRIVSLLKCRSTGFKMYPAPHIRGPVENGNSRTNVHFNSQTSPDGFTKYVASYNEIQSSMIIKQLSGVYRISISDYCGFPTPRWDMGTSCAAVQLYTGNKLWAEYFWPNRLGNAWSVVEINGTNLKPINAVNTLARREDTN